jgi:predicted N-formylglutamate amidohydrolase
MADEVLPPPFSVVNENGASPFVLVCEHASRFIPKSYEGLGLPESELSRHIAWDIGAQEVAVRLGQFLDAPLILAGYSRLIIDLNRPLGSPTSIPEISELTAVPGNIGLGEDERNRRAALYFTPFHNKLTEILDARLARGGRPIVVGIHSFTSVFKGVSRPWHGGILFRRSASFGKAFAAALGGEDERVAENQPYQIGGESDYTVPVHGEARGLEAVLVEMRQDLIADDRGAAKWAERLAVALSASLAPIVEEPA